MSPIQSVRHTVDRLGAHTMRVIADEDGMSTAEYAIGTIAAAAFGAILYTVVPESQDRLFPWNAWCTAESPRTEPGVVQVWIDNAPTANDWLMNWDGPCPKCSQTTMSPHTTPNEFDPSTGACLMCSAPEPWVG